MPGCPNNGGADATSGTTQIFFLYITQGELGSTSAIYGVANQCQGGVEYNNENIQIISNVLSKAPCKRSFANDQHQEFLQQILVQSPNAFFQGQMVELEQLWEQDLDL